MKHLLLFILIFFQMSSFAQLDEIKVARIRYTIQADDYKLEDVFRKFLKDGRSIKKDGEFVKLNIQRNWQIKDWEDLTDYEGEEMDIYLPPSYIDKQKFKAYLKFKELEANERRIEKLAMANHSRSVFYMASFGRFNQTQAPIDIKFQQNSPMTVGYSHSYKLSELWRISGSAYLSYLIPADTALSSESLSLRPEVGFNGYLGRNMGKYSLYAGFDFERFTTFDIDALISTQTAQRDETRVTFATFGIDKYLKNNVRGLLLRASISVSMTSSRTSYEGETLENPFTGLKFLLYANAPINEKYFFHALYKQHMMNGAGDLNVSRIGVGFGRKF